MLHAGAPGPRSRSAKQSHWSSDYNRDSYWLEAGTTRLSLVNSGQWFLISWRSCMLEHKTYALIGQAIAIWILIGHELPLLKFHPLSHWLTILVERSLLTLYSEQCTVQSNLFLSNYSVGVDNHSLPCWI